MEKSKTVSRLKSKGEERNGINGKKSEGGVFLNVIRIGFIAFHAFN